MSFIRIKKIKEMEYAYFVNNKWTKKGTRQKVSKYLGKIIRPKQTNNKDFSEKIIDIDSYIKKKKPRQLLDNLIEFELKKIGLKKEKDNYTDGKITFNSVNKSIINDQGRPVVLFINDGYFCQKTIKDLYDFNFKGNQKEVGTELANAFTNAGVKIPSVMFILLFQKIYTEDVTRIN